MSFLCSSSRPLPARFLSSQLRFPVPGLCGRYFDPPVLDSRASVGYANVSEAQVPHFKKTQGESLEGTRGFHENLILFVALSFYFFFLPILILRKLS